MNIPIEYYLIVSTVMLVVGIYGFLTRKNIIAMLISVELILNATDINFAVFNRYLYPNHLEGHFFALFGIVIAAAETAVAIAIMINVYRNLRSIENKDIEKMKH
jgi:NADH:ubiquinone oxidoreductase subunit K